MMIKKRRASWVKVFSSKVALFCSVSRLAFISSQQPPGLTLTKLECQLFYWLLKEQGAGTSLLIQVVPAVQTLQIADVCDGHCYLKCHPDL